MAEIRIKKCKCGEVIERTIENGEMKVKFKVAELVNKASKKKENLFFTCYAFGEEAKKIDKGCEYKIAGYLSPYTLRLSRCTKYIQYLVCQKVELVGKSRKEINFE